MADMAEFNSIKTTVKLTVMARERCRCCFSAQSLEKLCSTALNVYLSICNYKGFDNGDIQIKTCARCCEFLKEVHHFKIKCHAVDEICHNNPNVEDYEVESLLGRVIDEKPSQLNIKTEVIDEYDEIDQIDIQINKVEIDFDYENTQTILETSSERPLDSNKSNNDDHHFGSDETLLECDNMIDKKSSIILIEKCDPTMNSDHENVSVKSEEHAERSNDGKLVGTKRKNKSVAHTKDKAYKCTESSNQTKQQANVKSHATNKRNFKVDKLKYNLNEHKSAIHPVNERFFECNECSHKTKYRGNLIRHIVRNHRNPISLKCAKCSFITISIVELKDHYIREHSEEKPLTCNKCNYSGETKKDLRTHKRKHAFKRYKCDQCNYRSRLIGSLNVHTSVAHVINPTFYECNHCSYKSPYKGTLQSHIGRKHWNGISFTCDQCGSNFKINKDLETHKKRVHTEIPADKLLKCSVCPFKSKARYSLNYHIRRRHKHELHLFSEGFGHSREQKQL